ncbi:alanine racemase [Allobaculum stercoricanis]|uniref:alanine racemase n=1 Tax=Allobaculum stercoricanis TaxID=174709 RepID=UPI0023F189FB|nr:alanine racemase [Allobaculum stercoricanis]
MIEIDKQRTWAQIHYDRIAHNVKEVQKLIGNTKIMGIVKANAYGHGAVRCTQELKKAGIDYFAVACLSEAQQLRQAGIEDPILILGYTAPACFDELAQGHFVQSVVSYDYAKKLNAYGLAHNMKMSVHVKADTGMNRTGILYEDGQKDFEQICEVYWMKGLDVQGIFSHFPVSDDLGCDSKVFTENQIRLFNELVDRLKAQGIEPGLRHIQNSYGILNYKDLGMDYCRPGLLYMGVTSDDTIEIESNPDFIPILEWKTKVSLVKDVPDGATISYGRHYTCHGTRRIASLAIGYADGLSRMCSNQGLNVSIRGHLVPIVGNICMDQCMVDVTGFDDIVEGDVATLVGKDGDQICKVDEISRLAKTINNETLSAITSRVVRIDQNNELAK